MKSLERHNIMCYHRASMADRCGSTTLSTTKHKFRAFQLYGFRSVNSFVMRMKVTSSAKVYCSSNVCVRVCVWGLVTDLNTGAWLCALGLLFILQKILMYSLDSKQHQLHLPSGTKLKYPLLRIILISLSSTSPKLLYPSKSKNWKRKKAQSERIAWTLC